MLTLCPKLLEADVIRQADKMNPLQQELLSEL